MYWSRSSSRVGEREVAARSRSARRDEYSQGNAEGSSSAREDQGAWRIPHGCCACPPVQASGQRRTGWTRRPRFGAPSRATYAETKGGLSDAEKTSALLAPRQLILIRTSESEADPRHGPLLRTRFSVLIGPLAGLADALEFVPGVDEQMVAHEVISEPRSVDAKVHVHEALGLGGLLTPFRPGFRRSSLKRVPDMATDIEGRDLRPPHPQARLQLLWLLLAFAPRAVASACPRSRRC